MHNPTWSIGSGIVLLLQNILVDKVLACQTAKLPTHGTNSWRSLLMLNVPGVCPKFEPLIPTCLTQAPIEFVLTEGQHKLLGPACLFILCKSSCTKCNFPWEAAPTDQWRSSRRWNCKNKTSGPEVPSFLSTTQVVSCATSEHTCGQFFGCLCDLGGTKLSQKQWLLRSSVANQKAKVGAPCVHPSAFVEARGTQLWLASFHSSDQSFGLPLPLRSQVWALLLWDDDSF